MQRYDTGNGEISAWLRTVPISSVRSVFTVGADRRSAVHACLKDIGEDEWEERFAEQLQIAGVSINFVK